MNVYFNAFAVKGQQQHWKLIFIQIFDSFLFLLFYLFYFSFFAQRFAYFERY